MAIHERTSESEGGASPLRALIPEDRRQVGLEATWEIQALNETIRDLCEGLDLANVAPHELASFRLKVRGLTARIEQLNNVAMSVLDPDEDTADLARRVFGQRYANEAGHA